LGVCPQKPPNSAQTIVSQTINFLDFEFQLSMLSSSKISLWEGHFEGVCSPRTIKFGPNNCLTNNFLHYEFQLSTSYVEQFKNFTLKGPFMVTPFPKKPKFSPNSCLTIITSYIMSFNVLGGRWGVQGFTPLQELPNLALVSQITSYIMSFNFLCRAVQKFLFGRAIFGGDFTPKDPQIWPKQLSHKQLLHYEFQLSMLRSSKISL